MVAVIFPHPFGKGVPQTPNPDKPELTIEYSIENIKLKKRAEYNEFLTN